ncbi:MAG: ferredoxin--NADP reductase [Planctomycetota bacterium]
MTASKFGLVTDLHQPKAEESKERIVPEETSDPDLEALREQHYNATIIERIDCHENLACFRIRPDTPAQSFLAGQYVTLGLGFWEKRLAGTQPEDLPETKRSKLAKRAYSISCPMLDDDGGLLPVDQIDYLEFYITLVRQATSPGQPVPILTPRLFRLREGARLSIGKKIVGKYTLGEIDPNDTVLMLSTGTGEAPHNAMLATLLSQGHRGKIVCACCVRYRGDLAYLTRHHYLMDQFSNYRYVPCTTRERFNVDPTAENYVGKQYLQKLFTSGALAEAADDPLTPDRTHVFLCGNPAMIGYVPPGGEPFESEGMIPLLERAGFRRDDGEAGPGRIRFEKYW